MTTREMVELITELVTPDDAGRVNDNGFYICTYCDSDNQYHKRTCPIQRGRDLLDMFDQMTEEAIKKHE